MSAFAQQGLPGPPPLPAGWTEHKSPDGRSYYWNTVTKKSTYSRPLPPDYTAPAPPPSFAPPPPASNGFPTPQPYQHTYVAAQEPTPDPYKTIYGQPQRQRKERPAPTDRPKRKDIIPGCEPWLLIYTRLGRRFVHNPDTGVSLWKFPQDVMEAVVQFDIQRASGKKQQNAADKNTEQPVVVEQPAEAVEEQERASTVDAEGGAPPQQSAPDDDDEEIIEEIIEEEEEDEAEEQALHPTESTPQEQGELEFGFDDLEDLEDMQQEDDNDDNAKDTDHAEEASEEIMNEDEARSAFFQLLSDTKINPFTTWDAIIESNTAILDDYRYTLLPNTKSRREAFASWSTERIKALNEQKAHQAYQNPRIPFLAFLQSHQMPKLFWPEFKRKFKNEAEIRAVSISDKEKEQIYRDFLKRVTKMGQEALQADLTKLLKEIPASKSWNRNTSLDGTLPAQLLTDLRYATLKPKIRDPIIQQYIETLPEPVDLMDDDERAAHDREHAARKRQEAAIRQRQAEVYEKQRADQRNLAHGRSRLAENEEETRRAMMVDRRGLKDSL